LDFLAELKHIVRQEISFSDELSNDMSTHKVNYLL